VSAELKHPLVSAETIKALDETRHVHQFNDNAVRNTRSLGDLVGMTHLGVHLVRLESGYESTQFHSHQCDEEFLYILSGRGVAEIGDAEHQVGAGDFMGFSTSSPAHSLRNPFTEDLVYLMSGERNNIDICDYPRIQRRMYRVDGDKQYVDLNNLHGVQPKP
jgi:uncharacterized cupin superfamily protein